jgi:hypothetical protein
MGQGYAEKGALWRIGPAYARFASAVNADVAQLVARNLAKVQVAGSNPVVRSDRAPFIFDGAAFLYPYKYDKFVVEWPRGEGKGLQIPLHGFKSRFHLHEVLD